MHNLSTVIAFEITRAIKKKSFWIATMAFPILALAIAGVIFFSNKATDEAVTAAQNETFSIAYTDTSGIINPDQATTLKATPLDSKAEGVAKVKDGSLDAYFYYPADLSKQQIEVYGRDVGLFKNSRYSGVANFLAEQSTEDSVSPNVRTIISGKTNLAVTTYRDGVVYDGFKELIAPGIFLVLFYFLIAIFANQMLNSTIEEKENRVIEMILTTIEARTLIIGKIISLIALGFIQGALILLPTILGYILLHEKLSLPSIDLSALPLDPARIGLGAIIFALSFILFTGILVAIGAATPTAKEAGQFFGVVMMLIFGPLYAAPLFVSSPESPIVQALTYIPFTAPIPLMLRNAIGNLTTLEAIVSVMILAVTSAIVIALAIRIFRYGALEYSRKLSLKEIFRS